MISKNNSTSKTAYQLHAESCYIKAAFDFLSKISTATAMAPVKGAALSLDAMDRDTEPRGGMVPDAVGLDTVAPVVIPPGERGKLGGRDAGNTDNTVLNVAMSSKSPAAGTTTFFSIHQLVKPVIIARLFFAAGTPC